MRNPRTAVTTLFFLNGVVFSSFFARLPAVKDALGASDGQLGLALFLATAGLVVAQPLAGWMIARGGVVAVAVPATIVYAAGLPVAAQASSIAALAAVLFAMGLANGVLDVAINVMGVEVERSRGRRMLSSMHAAFSFGVMTGAGGGALAAAAAWVRKRTWRSWPWWWWWPRSRWPAPRARDARTAARRSPAHHGRCSLSASPPSACCWPRAR